MAFGKHPGKTNLTDVDAAVGILRYLCENGVQPEIWQDVVEELTDTEQLRQKGGALRGE